MATKTIVVLLIGLAFASVHLAEAEQPAKVYRIGYIHLNPPEEIAHLTKAFEDGLQGLGYNEGRNLVLERRNANGQQERLPSLAVELVRLTPDVIVSGGNNPVIAALKQATRVIPVVMAVSRDPVGAGFVESLAHPGANITGLSNDSTPEIIGKNLELLKETIPRLSRVGFFWNPVPPGSQVYKNVAESTARKLGITFYAVGVKGRDDFEAAFATLAKARVDGVLVLADPVLYGPRNQIVALAAKNRLPTMYPLREWPEAGGLMSYGPNILDQYRRAAVYVDKILKGAKPADLPVEQPTKFEFIINLKAAKQIGLTIPPNVLVRADRVIK
jgi:putative tryptophan/tyrosine transport system substrate-binding protein